MHGCIGKAIRNENITKKISIDVLPLLIELDDKYVVTILFCDAIIFFHM